MEKVITEDIPIPPLPTDDVSVEVPGNNIEDNEESKNSSINEYLSPIFQFSDNTGTLVNVSPQVDYNESVKVSISESQSPVLGISDSDIANSTCSTNSPNIENKPRTFKNILQAKNRLRAFSSQNKQAIVAALAKKEKDKEEKTHSPEKKPKKNIYNEKARAVIMEIEKMKKEEEYFDTLKKNPKFGQITESPSRSPSSSSSQSPSKDQLFKKFSRKSKNYRTFIRSPTPSENDLDKKLNDIRMREKRNFDGNVFSDKIISDEMKTRERSRERDYKLDKEKEKPCDTSNEKDKSSDREKGRENEKEKRRSDKIDDIDKSYYSDKDETVQKEREKERTKTEDKYKIVDKEKTKAVNDREKEKYKINKEQEKEKNKSMERDMDIKQKEYEDKQKESVKYIKKKEDIFEYSETKILYNETLIKEENKLDIFEEIDGKPIIEHEEHEIDRKNEEKLIDNKEIAISNNLDNEKKFLDLKSESEEGLKQSTVVEEEYKANINKVIIKNEESVIKKEQKEQERSFSPDLKSQNEILNKFNFEKEKPKEKEKQMDRCSVEKEKKIRESIERKEEKYSKAKIKEKSLERFTPNLKKNIYPKNWTEFKDFLLNYSDLKTLGNSNSFKFMKTMTIFENSPLFINPKKVIGVDGYLKNVPFQFIRATVTKPTVQWSVNKKILQDTFLTREEVFKMAPPECVELINKLYNKVYKEKKQLPKSKTKSWYPKIWKESNEEIMEKSVGLSFLKNYEYEEGEESEIFDESFEKIEENHYGFNSEEEKEQIAIESSLPIENKKNDEDNNKRKKKHKEKKVKLKKEKKKKKSKLEAVELLEKIMETKPSKIKNVLKEIKLEKKKDKHKKKKRKVEKSELKNLETSKCPTTDEEKKDEDEDNNRKEDIGENEEKKSPDTDEYHSQWESDNETSIPPIRKPIEKHRSWESDEELFERSSGCKIEKIDIPVLNRQKFLNIVDLNLIDPKLLDKEVENISEGRRKLEERLLKAKSSSFTLTMDIEENKAKTIVKEENLEKINELIDKDEIKPTLENEYEKFLSAVCDTVKVENKQEIVCEKTDKDKVLEKLDNLLNLPKPVPSPTVTPEKKPLIFTTLVLPSPKKLLDNSNLKLDDDSDYDEETLDEMVENKSEDKELEEKVNENKDDDYGDRETRVVKRYEQFSFKNNELEKRDKERNKEKDWDRDRNSRGRRGSPKLLKTFKKREASPRSRRRKSPPPKRRRRSPRRSMSPMRRSRSPRRRRSFSRSPRRRSISPRRCNRKRSLSPRRYSPVGGFKRSVADSTISDDMLQQQQKLDSPLSPKRISLDDRINQVLGLEKPENKPSPYIYQQQQQPPIYNNYPYDNYGPPTHQVPYQYNTPSSSSSSNYGPSNQGGTTKVVQVGNILQVVPNEEIIMSEEPKPGDGAQKIVQVGNMLQIVPGVLPTQLPPPSISTPQQCQSIPHQQINVIDKSSAEAIMKQKSIERKAERDKRRMEREQRRKEKERKRKEKEKRKQLKLKLKTENMIKKALQLETEQNDDDVDDEGDDGDEGDEPIIHWPPPQIVISTTNTNNLPIKSILMLENSTKRLLQTKKTVQFADGIKPGEGTSPSGGEELSSPPPQPPPQKEKRLKKLSKKSKKKKIKVKVIKKKFNESDEEEEDNLPPPSPPPGSPPPHIFPSRVKTHTINNIHPHPIILQQNHQFFRARPPHPHPQGIILNPALRPTVPHGYVTGPSTSATPMFLPPPPLSRPHDVHGPTLHHHLGPPSHQ